MNTDPTLRSTPTATSTGRRRSGARRMLLPGLALAAASMLAACGTSGGNDAAKTTGQSSTTAAPATADPTATTAAPASSGDEGGSASNNSSGSGSSGSSSGSGGSGTPAPTTPPAPSAPAPVITSFSTPENIDCHNGDFQNFTASWSATNVTKVTISIDGPGVYKTYGPTGSDSLPFNCSSSHTFLLTAYGQGGKTTTKSITLEPRSVQVPQDDTQEPGDD